MNKYIVRGEYGIHRGDYLEFVYRAKTEENAIKRFVKYVKKEYPHLWKKMGEHNVWTEEVNAEKL